MGIVRAIFVAGCFKKIKPTSKYLHLFDIYFDVDVMKIHFVQDKLKGQCY